MRYRIAFVLLWAAGAVLNGQTSRHHDELLEQIRERARQNLTRLPNYICAQTVERSRRADANSQYEPLDTLRLEVGLVGDRELFAWPDSVRFENKDVTELVQRGSIGNGAFALHARNVFLSGAPVFTFVEEGTYDGRRGYRYDFDVPLDRSTYKLRVYPRQARVPFHGSFWVDAETLDLMRLQVEVDDIPEELGVAIANDQMTYARVDLGASSFLLPKSSELNLVGLAGNASRNLTAFSACRQYVGESSISFLKGPEEEGDQSSHTVARMTLPARAEVELALLTDISPESAALGDPVRAAVLDPVREGANIVVPQGAIVLGRLVRLERNNQPVDHFVVGIEFHTLEFEGKRFEFRATMRKAGPASGLIQQAKRMDPVFDKKRKKAFMQILVNEQQRGQGILHWEAREPIVAKGLKMRWEVEP